MKLSLPNGMTSEQHKYEPTGPVNDRGSKSDAERQPRRRELGGWSRSLREREKEDA